jgi:Swt1-like HEPN
MAADRERLKALRSALEKKLAVKPRRLQQIVQKRRIKGAMNSEMALYTVASESGLDLSRFGVSAETLAEVRRGLATIRAAETPSTPKPSKRARGQPKPALVSIPGANIERLPGMTAAHAEEAAAMSQKVFPILYVFENSARDVISRVLERAFGKDWWNEVVPKKVKEKAADHKAQEKDEPWHGKRGATPIHYTLLSDLPKIVSAQKAWPYFEPLFVRPGWFTELVAELNVSRRVIAHMNPLATDDVKNVQAAFRRWAMVLKAKKDLLPP